MSTNKNQIIRNCYPWEWISVDLKGLSLKGVMFDSGVDQFDESSLKQYWCIVLIWLRFAVSQEVLKHLRWHFASYAGRSSKQTPSFILNLVSFFTLHCFLSLSITLWYCMVISLVSPRGGFRLQKKLITNFCKIDTIYNKVIALIFVVIVVVIIIIANVAILFCFEILVVTSWYMPMLVASEILWSKI